MLQPEKALDLGFLKLKDFQKATENDDKVTQLQLVEQKEDEKFATEYLSLDELKN